MSDTRHPIINNQTRPAVCIHLDPEIFLELERIAKARKTNKSSLVRPLIHKFVNELRDNA